MWPSCARELAKHIGTITLLPEGESVQYKGKWELLGGNISGAEGQS
jgi:hypothetical protein